MKSRCCPRSLAAQARSADENMKALLCETMVTRRPQLYGRIAEGQIGNNARL
jgi:hypothetical protein